MASKFLKVLLPTLTSFMVLTGLIELDQMYHVDLYSTDSNFDPGPQIDIPLFIILAIPFLFALLFQALAILPFWEKMKSKKQLIGLNIWQIVVLFSLSVGLLLVSIGLYNDGFMIEVLTSSTTMTSMFMLYWITNFLTLTFIDKKKSSR